ncbi:MAG: UbiA family prenyltransferase, partial [Dokdonia donghaensis]|nr:UbiA family prenyltransferase [Dokdonia donghaensis]
MSDVAVHTNTYSAWYDFKEITKMRLSISVVFSSVAGYFLAADTIDWLVVALLSVGGYFMVGASNAYNQVLERDLDALMDRTKNRPVASGRMSVSTALAIAIVFTIL